MREKRGLEVKNYAELFDESNDDLTPGERLDIKLRDQDSSNDGSEYHQEQEERSSFADFESPPPVNKKIKIWSPPRKKAPSTAPSTSSGLAPGGQHREVLGSAGGPKLQGGLRQAHGHHDQLSPDSSERVQDILDRVITKTGDHNKENLAPADDDRQKSPEKSKKTPKLPNFFKRTGGKYSTELSVKVLDKVATVVNERPLPYHQVCLNFQELVILPLLTSKTLVHNGKTKDFSSRWCRQIRSLLDDFGAGEDLDQFLDDELPGVKENLEILHLSRLQQGGGGGGVPWGKKKIPGFGVKEAFIESGIKGKAFFDP